MAKYWLDLFTPETWEESRLHGFKTSGFRAHRWPIVSRIKPGDYFICYLTRLSRLCGILKVVSNPYQNESKARKIWKNDSFPCLLDTKPVIALDFLHSIPKNKVVPKLSVSTKWGGLIRGSPVPIPPIDGKLIYRILKKSENLGREYPIEKVTKITAKKPRISKKQIYGTPMDFKRLRHAPINEQGVVYLFALVAKDLGFTVEAIGTSFPDCEAMRRIGGSGRGDRWQRIHIEFEYNSSDYRKHNHPLEGCDIIVCWKHDWKECPIEVIELSEVINKLGARSG